MRKLQFCLAVFALLTLTWSAFAQVQNGQITGTVTDPTGAAIANAKITVTNPATNLSASTTTNSSGNYTVKELPVGTYKVVTEASGFKTVSNADVVVNAGTISHVDPKMTMGQAREIVEVTGAAAAVNTEDSKLATTVSSTQINNLPLNGRNVFDLMQLSTGAVNVQGVDFENGHNTVVNGLREDFNGFLINGVSNKGLSGGAVNVPIEDSVEEFQQNALNMSSQYGNSAAGTVNLVTKSGTNAWHGSAWEYLRNDVTDANKFFLNQNGVKKLPVRFNQFGLTLGGPIVKDKLFFFLSLQGDRYRSSGAPVNVLQETQAWRDAVVNADNVANATGDPNIETNSTAALLYKTFVPANPGTSTGFSSDVYVNGFNGLPGDTPNPDYTSFLCLLGNAGGTPLMAQKWANIFGVTAQDQTNATAAGCGGGLATPAPGVTPIDRTVSIQESSVATFGTQAENLGNLFNGNEASLRLDYNWNTNNRFFINYNYNRQTDKFGGCNAACTRGFSNPNRSNFPQGSASFVHTFSPTILNTFTAGYLQNNLKITVNHGGVPDVGFGDGSAGFGSYNGYPQDFKENIYTYSDLVSISHGNHNMKVGVDFRRNIENSEFNVARPSYYFYDQVFFAADSPYYQVAGVDPGICKPPCGAFNQSPVSQLSSNFRHWRNLEMGAYFQDDWKVSKRLTLYLGIRYDLYKRHNEEGNAATTFILGGSTPNSFILGPSNALPNRLFNANIVAGNPGCDTDAEILLAQMAGVCGPGGFAPAKTLGAGDHNNFGPRVGFAWDMFGDGKTSLRGGFGVAYEGTLYNPLSNSRWNPPYYSFNAVCCGVSQQGGDVVWGPTVCDGIAPPHGNCAQDRTTAPTFTGPGTNPNQGPAGQAQAQGNIDGWDPSNPNQAVLTGIIFPQGIRDPYVYNFYLSLQREILPKTVVEARYVGTAGHKLFRAEDINREPGSLLPAGVTETDNLGRTLTGLGGRLNQNYGRLRNWQNAVNSNYNSLQASVKHQMSHGLLFNVDYTYSHSIDGGSTWHSGATTANGSAAGEGFTTDQTIPGLDRGNSIFDIRHRLVLNYVWQLPGQNLKGVMGAIAGGWSLNGIWSFQSGAHWEPFTSSGAKLREIVIVNPDGSNPRGLCKTLTATGTDDFTDGNCANIGGDFNLDRGRNDRPDSSVKGFSDFSRKTWAEGWFPVDADGNPLPPPQGNLPSLTKPTCLACVGNLGRNTFVGPGNWAADMTLSKIFKITERVNLKFDANAFNVFNRANFILATAGGGANNKPFQQPNFGQAAGTLRAREMQFGLKLSF